MVESAIQGLHRKGFSVMMDDFGSGYSSLNMLKDTNVDAIKLDKMCIRDRPRATRRAFSIVLFYRRYSRYAAHRKIY